MNSKTPKAEGKTGQQAYTHGLEARDEEKRDFTKRSKTWAQVTSNSAHMEKETHSQGDDMQGVIAQFVARRKGYKVEGQTSVT
jgi:hypothetical protein